MSEFKSRANIGCAFDILGSDEDIVAAFAWRASFLTFEASKHRDEQKKPWYATPSSLSQSKPANRP